MDKVCLEKSKSLGVRAMASENLIPVLAIRRMSQSQDGVEDNSRDSRSLCSSKMIQVLGFLDFGSLPLIMAFRVGSFSSRPSSTASNIAPLNVVVEIHRCLSFMLQKQSR